MYILLILFPGARAVPDWTGAVEGRPVGFQGAPMHAAMNSRPHASAASSRLADLDFLAPYGVNSTNSSVWSVLPTKMPLAHLGFNVSPSLSITL